MPVALDAQTVLSGPPQVGAAATVHGVIGDDGVLLAREITVAQQAAAEPTAAPTAAPTQPPAPIAEPAAAPTAAPTQPPAPTAEPAAAPGEPIAALRALLEAGASDGRAGEQGDDLSKRLRDVEKELAKGKTERAREKLRDLQRRVDELAREGKIDAAFAGQLGGGIAVVAEAYDLELGPRGGD